MDRNGAFIEYARILDETIDWLRDGYRRSDEAPPIIHPPQIAPTNKNSTYTSANFIPPEQVTHESDAATRLTNIADEIKACTKCNLNLIRKHTCPGRGRVAATLMVVTPPPGQEATEESSPFPSYEDEYLTKWLIALKLNPDTDAFITPTVKCHTPGRRPPQAEEAEACGGYLRRQVSAVAPKAILALGDAACGALTGNPRDFPSLVGKEWTWGNIPALVLWPPAEVLSQPNRLRRPVWQALQRFKAAWDASP